VDKCSSFCLVDLLRSPLRSQTAAAAFGDVLSVGFLFLYRLSVHALAVVLACVDAFLGHGTAVQEAVAVVTGFQDVAVMGGLLVSRAARPHVVY
jgi:uncharacterized protein (DUF934 family)